MSVANPIPRELRRADISPSLGQVTFGPFDYPIYDPLDVTVSVRSANTAPFVPLDLSAYTINLLYAEALPSLFTVTLAAATADGSTLRVDGARLASRDTDVTRGGTIRSVALEDEFDRITITLQEMRRDVDTAIAPDAATAIAEQVVAIAAAEIEDIKNEATAARDEAVQSAEDVATQVGVVTGLVEGVQQAKTDAQEAATDAADHDASAAAHDVAAAGAAAAAAGYAASLGLIIDYGFVADAPTETRDYGTVA